MSRFSLEVGACVTVLLFGGCRVGRFDDFPDERRVENAVSVRVTEAGLAEVPLGRALLGPLVTIPIPTRDGLLGVMPYTVCPGGPSASRCQLSIDAPNVEVTTVVVPPSGLRLRARVPVLLGDLPVSYIALGIPGTLDATVASGPECPGVAHLPLEHTVELAIEVDSVRGHASYGYTAFRVVSVEPPPLAAIHGAVRFCTASLVSEFIRDVVAEEVHATLDAWLSARVEEVLCLHGSATECPPDAPPDVAGICRRADGGCASVELGAPITTGLGAWREDPGVLDALLVAFGATPRAGLPPGFPLDLPFGSALVSANGLSMSMAGAAHAATAASCVEPLIGALPTGIPTPAVMLGNHVDGWPADVAGPHVGIAISERYLNWLLFEATSAGQFCFVGDAARAPSLTVPGATFATRGHTDVSACFASEDLILTMRPSTPPVVAFGNGTDPVTDPLVRLRVRGATFDVAHGTGSGLLATFRYDVSLALGLDQDGDLLVPTLARVEVTNPEVLASPGLTHDPEVVAAAASSVVGAFVSRTLADLPGFSFALELGARAPLRIVPPAAGIGTPSLRAASEGFDNFLVVFGSLAEGDSAPLDTTASVTGLTLDPAGFSPETVSDGNAPIVELAVTATGSASEAEFSFRIDGGLWRPFAPGPTLTVQDPWLRLQGAHTLAVRARTVGDVGSLDPTPAEVTVIVDADPPCVALIDAGSGRANVSAWDFVSDASALTARWRGDGAPFGDWTAVPSQIEGGGATQLDLEVRDEAGHVGSATITFSSDAGMSDVGPRDAGPRDAGTADAGPPAPGGGCGCRAASASRMASWVSLAGLVLILLRARGRARVAKPPRTQGRVVY